MKSNYKPSSPSVECPYCKRLIGTRMGKPRKFGLVFIIHAAKRDAKAKEPPCKGSLQKIRR